MYNEAICSSCWQFDFGSVDAESYLHGSDCALLKLRSVDVQHCACGMN